MEAWSETTTTAKRTMDKTVVPTLHEANELLAALRLHCAELRRSQAGWREVGQIEALIDEISTLVGNAEMPPG